MLCGSPKAHGDLCCGVGSLHSQLSSPPLGQWAYLSEEEITLWAGSGDATVALPGTEPSLWGGEQVKAAVGTGGMHTAQWAACHHLSRNTLMQNDVIHSSCSGRLGCFHLSAVVNSAASVAVHVSGRRIAVSHDDSWGTPGPPPLQLHHFTNGAHGL